MPAGDEERALDEACTLLIKQAHEATQRITASTQNVDFGKQEIRTTFAALEIKANDAKTLFRLLDRNASGSLNGEEFVDGCIRLRGAADGLDMAKLLNDSRWLKQTLVTLAGEISACCRTPQLLCI